jgi:hypothetical protein
MLQFRPECSPLFPQCYKEGALLETIRLAARAAALPTRPAVLLKLFCVFGRQHGMLRSRRDRGAYHPNRAKEVGSQRPCRARRIQKHVSSRFGSRDYAAEELIAELGAAFLCAEFGFDGDVRNAGYLALWIELLKADKRAFFTACSKASKAADYLRGLAHAEPAEAAA